MRFSSHRRSDRRCNDQALPKPHRMGVNRNARPIGDAPSRKDLIKARVNSCNRWIGEFALALGLSMLVGSCSSNPCGDSATNFLCFTQRRPIHIGFAPRALAAADLDSDGKIDLVVASELRGTLSVFWGQPSGLKAAATSWSIDDELAGVLVADIDADGYLDIATALPSSDSVAILHGLGDRKFSPPTYHFAGPVPRALIATDLDGVDPPEILTANLGDGSVSILRRLLPSPPVLVGSGPRGLVSGDFDSDGDNDVAVAVADEDSVQFLFGDGAGNLRRGTRHIVGSAPYDVVAADLDGDGKVDIASSNALSDDVTVLWGDGAGGLRAMSRWPTLVAPMKLVVLSEQAAPSLGILSPSTSTIQVLNPRNGLTVEGGTKEWATAISPEPKGTLLYASELAGEIGQMSPGVGLRMTPMWSGPPASRAWLIDLDGMNVDALFTVEPGSEFGIVRLSRDGPASATSIMTGLTEGARGVRAGRLTSDSRRDVVIWGSESLVVLVQQSDGSLLASTPPTVVSTSVRDVAIGDMNGNGSEELLVLSGDDAETRLETYAVDDLGTLSLSSDELLAAPGEILTLVDGDGGMDLLIRVVGGDFLYLENGALPSRTIALGEPSGVEHPAIGDLDGNGSVDAVLCSEDEVLHISNILANSPRTSIPIVTDRCDSVAIYDLNGNGYLDLLTRSVDEGLGPRRVRYTAWLQGPTGWIRGSTLGVILPESTKLQLARLDADNAPDLLLTGAAVTTEAMRGAFGPALVATPGPKLDGAIHLRSGDLNGDGATDLVGFSQSLGFALATKRGDFGPFYSLDKETTLGSSNLVIQDLVSADLDADGSEEIVIAVRTPSIPGVKLDQLSFNGSNGVSRKEISSLTRADIILYAADFDRDANLDILALGAGSQLEVYTLSGDGHAGFAEPQHSYAKSPAVIHRTMVFDMDNDGQLDVLGTSDEGILVFPNNDGTTFGAGWYWTKQAGDLYLPGNFDLDDLADMAVLNEGDLKIIYGVERDSESVVLLEDVSAIALLNLDIDGRDEILAAASVPNSDGSTSLLHVSHVSDGELIFDASEISRPPASALSVSDLDGDGGEDILWINGDNVSALRQEL